MPLRVPSLSDLSYQDLVAEALARIPVHTPEWTNFNDSDPGVTLVQLFAFLTENLLYRSNQIPERNRRKFLTLLGVGLRPATPASALVTFSNDRGALFTTTLPGNVELWSGHLPFRTTAGLDVLPIEWRVVFKQAIPTPPPGLLKAYQDLYQTYGPLGALPALSLYQTVSLTPSGVAGIAGGGVNLARDTADGALWIALLRRTSDSTRSLDDVRAAIERKTISLALVPVLTDVQRSLASVGRAAGHPDLASLMRFEVPAGGSLLDSDNRQPRYRALDALTADDLQSGPGVIQLTLPSRDKLTLWDNIDPLEPGVGNLPPSFEDTTLNDRIVTWIRIRLGSALGAASAAADGVVSGGPSSAGLTLLCASPNTVFARQRAHVSAEMLPLGTGTPDQVVFLSHPPVVPGSVQLSVDALTGPETWVETDDLLAAGPEVHVIDSTAPPGSAPPVNPPPAKVFALDPESGQLRFGDGLRGWRPPYGATLRADYDYSVGSAGNVAAASITSAPTLAAGFGVRNDLPAWGGSDSESVDQAEKEIPRYIQHRDRLVTAEDFRAITARTPGIDVGRVEVLAAYNPDLTPNEPGDSPGAVTLMVIPRADPQHQGAPQPDALFLNAICGYLEPRRLVTTEVFVRGPDYNSIWISIGIRVDPGASVAVVREAVKQAVLDFLAPLPAGDAGGWPLSTPVVARQILAVASRVTGVFLINDALLALEQPTLVSTDQVDMVGLQLPRVLGISVVVGDPLPLQTLRDQTIGLGVTSPTTAGGPGGLSGGPIGLPLPVPVIPQECQ